MPERLNRAGKWPIRFLALAGSALALWLVLRRLDLSVLAEVFRSLHWGWFLAALALFGVGLIPSGFRWHLMLRLNDCHVTGGASVRLVFVSHFFNTLLLGPSSGDVPKTVLYSRWFGLPAADVLAASMLDRMVAALGGIAFALLAIAAGAFGGGFDFVNQISWHAPPSWVWLLAMAVIGACLGAVTLQRHRPESFLGRTIRSMGSGLGRLRAAPKTGLRALGLSVSVVAVLTLAQVFCVQAVSAAPVHWLKLFWSLHLATMAASLPITVAGAGVREGAYVLLLGLYGVAAPQAVAAALLTLSLHTFWALVGLALWWWEQRLRNRLPRWSDLSALTVILAPSDRAADLNMRRQPVFAKPTSLNASPENTGATEQRGEAHTDFERLAATLRALPNVARVVVPTERASNPTSEPRMAETADIILYLPPGASVSPDAFRDISRCLRDSTVVGGCVWSGSRTPLCLALAERFVRWLGLWWNGSIPPDYVWFARCKAIERIKPQSEDGPLDQRCLRRRLRRLGRLAFTEETVA